MNNYSNQRHVVLYGAFDRYNYGDNLMPILLEMYLSTYHQEKNNNIKFIYSSIMKSDLSNYGCKPTIPMRDLLDIQENSTIIVVGGEVLGADVGVLYTHVQTSALVVKLLKLLRRHTPFILRFLAKYNYDAVWDYPYIPNKKSFKNQVKVIYNTVGAIPDKSQEAIVKQADYISVRDERTYNSVSKLMRTNLVPDSVLMVSKIVDFDFLEANVRDDVKKCVKDKRFITVQACPYKVKFSAKKLAKELDLIKKNHDIDVVLLPIGYASGHDDSIFLKGVKESSNNDFVLLDNLTVWEIMYVIARSEAFYGTSLHGVITAMSFCVPHFCINDEIEKLVSFLKTWSVYPYTQPINIDELSNSIDLIKKHDGNSLSDAVNRAQQLIFNSIDDIVKLL